MTFILTALVIVFILIKCLVFVDIILSWLTILWLNIRPMFIASILDPIYEGIKWKIPTTIWPLDFTPIVILIFMEVFIMFIYWLDTQVYNQINNLFAML